MPQIISTHSFRGGTGKSNTTANLAVLVAKHGYRVGVIDTDIQSPGIHVLFNVRSAQARHSLNDYLWGRCRIEEAAYDVTAPGHWRRRADVGPTAAVSDPFEPQQRRDRPHPPRGLRRRPCSTTASRS